VLLDELPGTRGCAPWRGCCVRWREFSASATGRESASGLSYRFRVSITTLFRTTSPARLRAGARAGVLAAATGVPLLAAAAALASTNHNYDGEDSGPGLTVLQTLGSTSASRSACSC